MVWLLYGAVRSSVLFGYLIQNSCNRALPGVVFLLSPTLVNFSHWWGTLALRVGQHMWGYVWVLWRRKLLENLLRLLWTCTLLDWKDSLGLFCLKLGGMLLLHQKLLILKTLSDLRILYGWADLIDLLMWCVYFRRFETVSFLNLSWLELIYSFDRAIWQTQSTTILIQIFRTLLSWTWCLLTFLTLSVWRSGRNLHLNISILSGFKARCRSLRSIKTWYRLSVFTTRLSKTVDKLKINAILTGIFHWMNRRIRLWSFKRAPAQRWTYCGKVCRAE